jgi:hypothetical protein
MSSPIGCALIEIKLVERAGMSAVELLAHERIFNNCHRTALAAVVAAKVLTRDEAQRAVESK